MVGHTLDWLLGGVTSFEGKAMLSLVLLGLVAVAMLLARKLRVRAESAEATRVINAAIAVALLGILGVVGWIFVVLWELSVTELFGRPALLATRVTVTLVLLIGIYLGTGIVRRAIYEFTQQQTSITQHQTELIFRITQVSVYALATVVVLGLWNVNLGGLLVGAGFLGIVIGLAARQTLGSLIAGFVLMFARPFEIGDWVAIGENEGIVTEITIVNTRIQTFDGEYAMLPNDFVGSSQIINRTRKGRLRLHVRVGVDYTTDLELAQSTAKEALTDVDEVLTVPQPDVVIQGFEDSAIMLDCRFWIDKPSARRRWRAQTAVVKAIKEAFDEAGIKIPFPQRELMGREESGGFKLGSEPPAGIESPDTRDGE